MVCMLQPRPDAPRRPVPARLRLSARTGLLAVLGFLGPLAWIAPAGSPPELGVGALVWADDGDGDGDSGDSGGDDGGDDGASSAGSQGGDSGSAGVDSAPARLTAAWLGSDEHLPNELLALNPSSDRKSVV